MDRISRDYYLAQVPLGEQLCGEVQYAISDALAGTAVKLHSITGRVKAYDSLLAKARAKNYADPVAELNDFVGVRVVALFLADLPTICSAVRSSFEVIEADDKTNPDDDSSFGYSSIHLVCRLGAGFSGPRYNRTLGQRFEVQVRTLLMDAWANVSHYLDYKGAASIPSDLRRDFSALSGLFFVADRHFELFYSRTLEEARLVRAEGLPELLDQELNRETLHAYIDRRFPAREVSPRKDVSRLVQELARAGVTTVLELNRLLEGADEIVEADEEDSPPLDEDGEPTAYTRTGAVRVALKATLPNWPSWRDLT